MFQTLSPSTVPNASLAGYTTTTSGTTTARQTTRSGTTAAGPTPFVATVMATISHGKQTFRILNFLSTKQP